MTALRVVLVDDEPLGLERLEAAFEGLTGAAVVGTARDGVEAAETIAALKPDLVILDIQMPGQDGIAVAAGLRAEPRPEVIFVTAFDHYAPAAFEVEAADYLLKPVKFERLRVAVERARRRREMRDGAGRAAELERALAGLRAARRSPAAATGASYDDELWAPGRNGVVRVPVGSIDWIEAARDYVLLHTAVRSHILRATMASLEKRLDPREMLRVHRSAFVRPDAITALQRLGKGLYAVVLRDGTVVQVGPTYAEELLDVLGLDKPSLDTPQA